MRITVLNPAFRSAQNLAFTLTCVISLVLFAQMARAQSTTPAAVPVAGACPAILNYTFPRLQDEKPQSLCQYGGKVVLIVNTASFCGFTPQYKGLEALDSKYRSRGLVVLGFPSNDFSQESGSNKEIADFCESTFGVKFPMFSKSSVRGSEANPLFNEVLVGIRDKDNYNRDVPTSDATKYQKYALNPEVAVLINAVYGTKFVTTGRTDLAAVYIPDVIRVDTTTGPANIAGQAAFSRLGFIGGDTLTNGAGAKVPGGWPNGRRLGDDVVDVALTAVASGPSYSSVNLVGDNIDHNDQVYNMTFPYAGTPNAGTANSKDSTPAH